jgi:hypothetical protein
LLADLQYAQAMNDSFARAIDHFNAEDYREALPAFEERWSAERTEFLRGLIQLCCSPSSGCAVCYNPSDQQDDLHECEGGHAWRTMSTRRSRRS